jgi:hypothetical protein
MKISMTYDQKPAFLYINHTNERQSNLFTGQIAIKLSCMFLTSSSVSDHLCVNLSRVVSRFNVGFLCAQTMTPSQVTIKELSKRENEALCPMYCEGYSPGIPREKTKKAKGIEHEQMTSQDLSADMSTVEEE